MRVTLNVVVGCRRMLGFTMCSLGSPSNVSVDIVGAFVSPPWGHVGFMLGSCLGHCELMLRPCCGCLFGARNQHRSQADFNCGHWLGKAYSLVSNTLDCEWPAARCGREEVRSAGRAELPTNGMPAIGPSRVVATQVGQPLRAAMRWWLLTRIMFE